ncbi:MAG: S1 RNA-binding domain-containing protein [Firmicutes bacterium]|nr:S1 RNA-binding domain-containing protein [Bacillota bacterium]
MGKGSKVVATTQGEEFNLDLIEQSFQSYKIGMVVNGTVISTSDKRILVNIGGKADGVIEGDEVAEFKDLKKGSKVDVMITGSKITEGTVPVSAKKAAAASEANTAIPGIKNGEKFEAKVESVNSAGLTCFFGSWRVFVPAREIDEYYVRNLDQFKGQTMTLVATGFNDERREIVASRKLHLSADKVGKQEMFWHSIFVNKLVKGKVVRITNFGAFVEVDGVDCLVHNVESSHEKGKTARDMFEVGKEYDFRVISVDRESGRVSLSHKKTIAHPFDEKSQDLDVGQEHEVVITKVFPFGALAKLDSGLEGMIHISEMSTKYVQAVSEVCAVGDKKSVIIIGIDDETRKIALSIKAFEEKDLPMTDE